MVDAINSEPIGRDELPTDEDGTTCVFDPNQEDEDRVSESSLEDEIQSLIDGKEDGNEEVEQRQNILQSDEEDTDEEVMFGGDTESDNTATADDISTTDEDGEDDSDLLMEDGELVG